MTSRARLEPTTWLDQFCKKGKADVIVGGQWGSEGKGAAAAYLARRLAEAGRFYDMYTTNAGAQAGHTSIHNGHKRVVFHLPTAALIAMDYGQQPFIFLNGGSIIDPDVLLQELSDNCLGPGNVFIHPNAAIITPECKEAEGAASSVQTKIASTRKGVGEALARKVLRTGMIASQCAALVPYLGRQDVAHWLAKSGRVLVEVPQGIGLSVDSQFYPYCTSRNCTLQQGLADAGVHPRQFGASVLVLRTTPIRVGNIVEDGETLGRSGDCYNDHDETSWASLGVAAEITTVTKRVRRVFSFSLQQVREALKLTRPDVVHLTFCDYPVPVRNIVRDLEATARSVGLDMTILRQYGPTTDDVEEEILP